MAKFEVHVSVGLVGCDKKDIVEIPDEELAQMDEKLIEDVMRDAMFQMIDWNYHRIEE
jgi:hypothetical protein